MKEKFWQYILDNFTIDNDGRKIISNIIDWFWMESFDNLLIGIRKKQEFYWKNGEKI